MARAATGGLSVNFDLWFDWERAQALEHVVSGMPNLGGSQRFLRQLGFRRSFCASVRYAECWRTPVLCRCLVRGAFF